MRTAEILEIIANGESSGVEFKRDSVRPEKLAREIVAMANVQGGRILLGVEDDGSISGIARENLREWVFDTVLGRYVHPLLIPYYEEVVVGEQRIAVLTFSQGVSKPYVLRSRDREDMYVRLGSVSKLATREQQIRLSESGGMLHTEIMPVSGTSLSVLDDARLENYVRDILRDPDVPTSRDEWIERLLALGLMVRNVMGEPVCTIAGLVLFGIRPRRYLRQAGIRLMAFRGDDKEYQALMDVVLDAPMVGRWRIEDGQRELIDSGLIEKFIESIGPFVSREAAEIDENFRREKTWLYPLEAVRETVVNALAHRDWTRFVDVEVGVYSNRLEAISPGALPNSMNVEKMRAGQRSMRNQIIMEVLRDYGYVDARGMGVRTKVIPLMRAANGREPLFQATDDFMRTVLEPRGETSYLNTATSVVESTVREHAGTDNGSRYRVTPRADRSQKRDIDLISALKRDPNANYAELAGAVGVSPATIKRRLQKLKRQGVLVRVGSKKTGRWEVKD